ncbi:helix-turn-helix domain-containing protein [Massilia forsythiae]|uniref:Helix-turn-helix domain-containing protein n=1 Tax=Massilia forsythiae TaxID=2728020 RepID=A0A7Z2VV82_9BURK|nr:helix-turn-helix domain-containing protein [Massilia forsythiae]QJD99732.1 helix-turn-helix domain-containing protein [Massilia forsythiae]
MILPVNSVAELGLLIRATRRAHRLRLDDVAGSANLGAVFVGDVERGKETVQLGRVLRLLEELGIQVALDVPPAAMEELEKLRAKGVRPPSRRRRSSPAEGE